ncbi:hypothetical protein [Reinekea blandensis]|uniref:Lipoprotein n=1 Tax=Reinekea blandensis MED297 TaxID=314283 RepID=A4BH14_9GAMM|nr:hypothetical protein [Reinekea blandensis]EAR08513.1 hypothetical protein MED297_14865 [Reinekea sp. MED297] [Reinekea blandensis MED297]
MNTLTERRSSLTRLFASPVVIATTLVLSGCYVDISHELEAGGDTDSHTYAELDDYSTRFLVDAAIVPVALSTESGGMVSDPDQYTTPQNRIATRAVIIETTYAYLFEDRACDLGGVTETEAQADTTSYSDGYTYVDLWLNASAYQCETVSQGTVHRINSDLSYDVTGWYDDWGHQISSLDADLNGWVNVHFNGRFIEHKNLTMQTYSVNGDDLASRGSSRIELDDGYRAMTAYFQTETDVHLRLGETLPHAGTVEFRNSRGWVELTFESDGVWRRDSLGRDRFIYWSTLY